MTTYRVHYEIDEAGYWFARVEGVQGCHTQGRSLETARERIREALDLCVDNAKDATLDEVFKPARAVTRKAKAARERAEKAQDEAQTLMRDAVMQLLDSKLSYRDMAVLLGISHQRVSQLAKEAHKPKEVAGSRRR